MINELSVLKEFATHINTKLNGKLYLVGGAVRDMILGIQPKDYDLELFHVHLNDFESFLTIHNYEFKFNSDAKFPVYRINIVKNILDDDLWVEIGFPRVDNKTGPKHSDYNCLVNPYLTVVQASLRRDFTINAVYYNLVDDIYENNGYHADINNKILAPVHEIKFKEDALRIMRGFQLVSRFGLSYGTVIETIDKDMSNELFNIDPSGIYAEFVKGITKSTNIFAGLSYLTDLADNEHTFFDIINEMRNCKQNLRHHAEGSVWQHTKRVIEGALELAETDDEKVLLFFAAFFHDIGKMKTFKLKDGQPTAYGHDVESDDLVEKYGARFGLPKKMIQQIIVLKHCHMIGNDAKNKKLYFMAEELNKAGLTFEILLKLMAADTYGSIKCNLKSRMSSHSEFYTFMDRIKRLDIERKPLKPFITGNDILTIAHKLDGKIVGNLLHEMKMLQYNNRVNNREEALDFLNARINNILNKSEVDNG
jgi:tRNA nucleotidyltransferase (CCA-adding enzyme)